MSQSQPDYTAARGSNTGDAFHELWAARQALRLLSADESLKAITVEGVAAEKGSDARWEGVDCGLYFGGTEIADADRVALQQLKYSASAPKSSWTAARLATGKNGKPTTSPIRRLADAYKGAVKLRDGKPHDSVQVSLITNQPISAELLELVDDARNDVPVNYKTQWKPGMSDLHRLVHASGLKPADFKRFAQVLDLKGNSGSRFAIEGATLQAISEWTDVELQESADRVRKYIRDQMLPEAAGELITRQKVLVQFARVSDDYALFPCPSEIQPIDSAVPREAAANVVRVMESGQQQVCLHGPGGVGKTTTLQQVAAGLPIGSIVITYDCYGGGSYLDASALRHRSQDAFVQLSNDLARTLRLPLLLVPTGPADFPRLFRKRLGLAAAALVKTSPGGLLVIAIDAADNAILAAQERSPPEVSFVHDLMSFDSLPSNVRILVTARSGRLGDLKLPTSFRRIPIGGFDRTETEANVRRFWQAPSDWIDDFHHLSGGVPRVQAYAFKKASDEPLRALDALRPFGKNLDQVFAEQFSFALSKNARGGELEHVCAGLITLPRPIPLADLSAVLAMPEETVEDICSDLAPGVRRTGEKLSFADEDFEAFVREAGKSAIAGVQAKAASHFLQRAATNEYAALNVAPALLAAGRPKDLLDLVEVESEPSAEVMPDPIRRRETQVKRLQTAIRVCREAQNPSKALRFLLIGAEAIKTEDATLRLLVENPGLTARYARDTASRLILGDPDRIQSHGPLLFHLLAEDASRQDAIAVREGRRRVDAWIAARWHTYLEKRAEYEHASAWPVSAADIAAALYSRLLIDGVNSAISYFRGFSHRQLMIRASQKVIERLLAEGRLELLRELARNLSDIHALFILGPMAAAGLKVDADRLAAGLRWLNRRVRLSPDILTRWDSAEPTDLWVIETALSSAEILAATPEATPIVLDVLRALLDPALRRVDRLYDHQHLLLDAILRSLFLKHALAGEELKSDQILTPRPKPTDGDKAKKSDRVADDHDRRLGEFVAVFAHVYSARAKLLVSNNRDGEADAAALDSARAKLSSSAWSLDRNYNAYSMRAKAAESVSLLLGIGVAPLNVLETALSIRKGWSSQNASGLFHRLAANTSIQGELLTGLFKAAEAERVQRTSAEARSAALAKFARLIGFISPSDADAVFKWAIDVAGQLDAEVMDQLRTITALVRRSRGAFGEEGAATGLDLSEIVRDAAIRLDGYENFPWKESITALSHLDYSLATAAVARWDDAGVANLGFTLDALILAGLETNQISAGEAAAMSGMLQTIDGERCVEICRSAPGQLSNSLCEEFATDCLLGRLSDTYDLSEYLSEAGTGSATTRLRQQREFERLLDAEQETAKPRAIASVHTREQFKWADGELVDDELLGATAKALTEKSRGSDQFVSVQSALLEAGEQVQLAARVEHLDALARLDRRWGDDDALTVLMKRLDAWIESPAVAIWRNQHLPDLISQRLPYFSRRLPYRDGDMQPALRLLEATGAPIAETLLRGVERNVESLGSSAAFALTGLIASKLDANEIADLCKWYVRRLSERVAADEREGILPNDLPATVNESLGRFYYAYLGDVDLRIRWRAAHAVRRLARTGQSSTIESVIAQYARTDEPVFREKGAPFYWVAAQLWLLIAIDRISLESPGIVAKHGKWLVQVGTDESFPHILVREFARDACQKLVELKLLQLTSDEQDRLAVANSSKFPKLPSQEDSKGSFDSFSQSDEALRFRFDGMDTLRYWYQPFLRMFADVTASEFLRTAEHWIVDKWGIREPSETRVKEPRQHRFQEGNWHLASNSHGGHPTLEHFQTYLEWHAMWCAAGDLLKSRPLAEPRYDDDDEFVYRLKYNKLTVPPYWLADLACPVPLVKTRWEVPGEETSEWIENVSDEELLREVLASDLVDYVVVHAHVEDRSSKHFQTTRVLSALVSPETAHSLVRPRIVRIFIFALRGMTAKSSVGYLNSRAGFAFSMAIHFWTKRMCSEIAFAD